MFKKRHRVKARTRVTFDMRHGVMFIPEDCLACVFHKVKQQMETGMFHV